VGGSIGILHTVDENNPVHATMLRAFLADHDEPCPTCGYSLMGLTEAVCPECGKALRLRVVEEEPSLGLYLTGLIGLSIGLGFNGLILMFIVGSILWYRLRDGISVSFGVVTLLPLAIGAAVCGSAIVLWLKCRKRVRSASIWNRRLLAAVCWLVALSTSIASIVVESLSY